jgi:hypothetical protein
VALADIHEDSTYDVAQCRAVTICFRSTAILAKSILGNGIRSLNSRRSVFGFWVRGSEVSPLGFHPTMLDSQTNDAKSLQRFKSITASRALTQYFSISIGDLVCG